MSVPPELDEPASKVTVAPPVDPAAHDLPFAELHWDEFEKLCLRLARREGEVEHAQRFGTPGQAQAGIDIYSRDSDGDYTVYQCRKVESLTAGDLRKAVDDFAKGDWSEASTFVFCTSQSSVPVKLALEVEQQAARLRDRMPSVEFRIWDAEALGVKLKEHPDLVLEFFGPAWLQRFLPSHVAADRDGQLDEMQETLTRVEEQLSKRVRVFIFDWKPEQARDELALLADEDEHLFEKLEDRIGNPPEPLRVRNLVAERPEWLDGPNARPWRILALLAERAGEWETATVSWEQAASRESGDERAGLLVAAAVTANVGGDKSKHDMLLEEARQLAPGHPRVLIQQVDQTSSGEERLAFLEGVESDDPPVAALLACHRTLASLLIPDIEQARIHLKEAQQLNPQAATVRMTAVCVDVHQGRLDASNHCRLDYRQLVGAHDEALDVLAILRGERRNEESVRVLMLAADALTLVEEPEEALALLSTATKEELTSSDGAEVLGDAALRAFGWKETLDLISDAAESPGIQRIRASGLVKTGSPRDRALAVETLDEIVNAGSPESPHAALVRLGTVLEDRGASWSDEAEQVLRDAGYERAADSAKAFYLDRRVGDPEAAKELLDQYQNEAWALLAKLRLAAMRNDLEVMDETARALLVLAPAQDVLVECGRALGLTGDIERAREVLVGVARDGSCPPATRAEAYALLIPLEGQESNWAAAATFHREWSDVRPKDDRAHAWAPRIANRLRESAS